MTNYIYTFKKTGAQFTNLTTLENGKFQLTSVEDPTDVITTTESVLKRWYKKSVEVDFTTAEEKPEDTTEQESTTEEQAQPTEAKKPKAKKQSKPRAKTYEEQKWGLKHFRITSENFCALFELSEVEYDAELSIVNLKSGEDIVARRSANLNELTGSVWFRFQNAEYELTDIDADNGVEEEIA